MTKTNDPPLVASVALIPDSDEKADLDAPSDESGKLVVGQVPNISISETIVVADQTERLSLEVQEGDVAIQQDTTESFIFTGGANVEINWQLVQFDAVGGIAGEDIAPRDIDGRNVTLTDLSVNGSLNGADTSGAAAGEALTSDGAGGFGFASVGGIEEVATFDDLPAVDPPQLAYVIDDDDYYHSNPTKGGFEIANATFDKSISTQEDLTRDIAFSSDGTRLYEVNGSTEQIVQSSLSTPFDIASATFEKSINSQDSGPTGIAFKPDGTRLYEIGNDETNIYQLSLSTPFDIASASLQKTINPQDTNATGIAFNPEGTRMYESANTDADIFQSNLSTPFDIASASFHESLTPQDAGVSDVDINPDGTRLYELGFNDEKIHQYNLSIPFEIGSAILTTSISAQDRFTTGITFDSNGTRFFQVGFNQDQIYQLQIPTGGWVNF